MPTKVRIEMNHDGWRELLSSEAIAREVDRAGQRIAAEAGDGWEYRRAMLGYGGGRVGGFVSSTHDAAGYAALLDEATNKTLTKAVHP